MTYVERIVRIFHESWDLRDPERGASSLPTTATPKMSPAGSISAALKGTKMTTTVGVQPSRMVKSRSPG